MHPPYGPKPRGLVVFYPDQRMMSVLCDGRRELPPGETVRELQFLLRQLRLRRRETLRRVSTPRQQGPRRRRAKALRALRWRAHGADAEAAAVEGVMQHRELIWERVADAPAN